VVQMLGELPVFASEHQVERTGCELTSTEASTEPFDAWRPSKSTFPVAATSVVLRAALV
jgi:hypothetical protein